MRRRRQQQLTREEGFFPLYLLSLSLTSHGLQIAFSLSRATSLIAIHGSTTWIHDAWRWGRHFCLVWSGLSGLLRGAHGFDLIARLPQPGRLSQGKRCRVRLLLSVYLSTRRDLGALHFLCCRLSLYYWGFLGDSIIFPIMFIPSFILQVTFHLPTTKAHQPRNLFPLPPFLAPGPLGLVRLDLYHT